MTKGESKAFLGIQFTNNIVGLGEIDCKAFESIFLKFDHIQ